jgi:CelD/BcsL family acetyltransferase involved in cellulose biosynthesis
MSDRRPAVQLAVANPQAAAATSRLAAHTAHAPNQSNDRRLSRLEILHAVEPVAEEWDDLADRVGGSPFLRPGWVEAWWRAFGTGRLEIVVLRRAGRLAALIPLHTRLGRRFSTSNWHTPQFGMLAETDAAREELAAFLFKRRPTELSLAFVDAAGPDLAAFRAAAAEAGYRTLERTLQRSPDVVIDGTWDGYMRRLSRKRRAELGRCRRRLEDRGRLVLEVATGEDNLDELLNEAFRVEATGWKVINRSAIASRPETRRFYGEIGHWAVRRGFLRVAFLRLDDHPLAVQYFLESDGTHYALKGGFDPAFERSSPGIVLLQALLERAFATGLRLVSLGGDLDPYKAVFATGDRDYRRFQAFAPSPAGWVHRLAFKYGRPAAKRLQAWVRDRRPVQERRQR